MKKYPICLLLLSSCLLQAQTGKTVPSSQAAAPGATGEPSVRAFQEDLAQFGDSITSGYDIDPAVCPAGTMPDTRAPLCSWGGQMALDFSGSYHNYAVSGDQGADMANSVYAHYAPPMGDNLAVTVLIGHNDMHWCPGKGSYSPGDSTGCKDNFSMDLLASLAWMAVTPGSNKVAAQSATYSSDCTADSAVRAGLGVRCSHPGDAVSFSLKTVHADQPVYVAWYGQDNNPGAANLAIDGVHADSLTTAGAYGQAIASVNGAASTVWARRYIVAAPGVHTITLTVTSSSGFIIPEWVGTPAYEKPEGAGATIFVGDLLYEAAGKYAQGTADYNRLIADLVSTLAADGLRIAHVPTSQVTQQDMGSPTATVTETDGTVCQISKHYGQHPTNCGYWHLRQAFEAAIRKTQPGGSGPQ